MTKTRSVTLQDLDEELKKASPIIKQYIEALKAENLKVQQQCVKFKAESVSYKNLAATAESELHKIQVRPQSIEDLLKDL
jgi:hypothetical protein